MTTPDIDAPIPASTAELLDRFAQRIGITLEEFWKEIEDHFVKHPGSELSEYLVNLSNTLEANPCSSSKVIVPGPNENSITVPAFSPKLRQAAILIQTLQGRLLLAQQHTDAHEKHEISYYEIAKERGETISQQAQTIQHLEAQITDLENTRDVQAKELSFFQGQISALGKEIHDLKRASHQREDSATWKTEINVSSGGGEAHLRSEYDKLVKQYGERSATLERLRVVLFHARPALLAELLCPTNPHT